MKSKTQGFTLIELLIVIAIIGILAAVLIPNLLAARTRAQSTAAQSYAREVVTALESLQGTNTSMSYAESAANVVVATGGLLTTANIILGVTPNDVPFTPAQLAEVLKAPTNGVQEATYFPAGLAPATARNFVGVRQQINADTYCTVLLIALNKIETKKAVANGACAFTTVNGVTGAVGAL